ncbi:DUF1499 domain-containing protein [Alsobacter sp. SYSU M60028]|uniref:DUF1499 domain-containing protein n=2 Tax=Alsobacter ponti TaxID=2962936 RepID=A0ABT1L8L1_9HYPH|nr:DUF1499 domain-containing protein [Alsobacter ponti]
MIAFAVPILLAVLFAAARAFPDGPIGLDRLWERIGGPADQGPVDFTRLMRRADPNDALACPRELCPDARADIVSPVWDVPYHDLRERLRAVILADPGARQVAEATPGRGDRFVVRTPVWRFPDTVDVMVLPVAGGGATVAIYSRSLLGRSDFGANLARIRGYLADPRVAAGTRPAQP